MLARELVSDLRGGYVDRQVGRLPSFISNARATDMTIPTAIVSSVEPAALSDRQVQREFVEFIQRGARLICAGDAKGDPSALMRRGHTPKSKLCLFDTAYYLTHPRQNPDLRFFVAYVVPSSTSSRRKIFARIFYKDISLIWRVASHLFLNDDEMWIGKGDTKIVSDGDWEREDSVESTTDLPFEIQSALESLNQVASVRQETAVLPLVLRRAPRQRIRAYDDFLKPRRLAAKNVRNRINRGRRVVGFQRPGDPTSLRIAPGFEPDFSNGLIESWRFSSRFYGGDVDCYRILSSNNKIQHLFFASPNHVWMIPPQALTTELSNYGVRSIDVEVDDDAYIPGYEYHFFEHDLESGQPQLQSQIPDGYARQLSPLDTTRADASAWLDQIPLIQEFRQFLARRSSRI